MNVNAAWLVAAMLMIVGGRVAHRLVRPRLASRRSMPASGMRGRVQAAIRPLGSPIAESRERRRGVRPQQAAAWCDGLSRRLRSGASLRDCVQREVPADPLLAQLTSELRIDLERGMPMSIALARAGERWTADRRPVRGVQHLDLVSSVIAAASALGGSAAAPLDRVAAALRLRAADGEERAAHSAQARMSAHVLTAIPLLVIGLLLATDPEVRNVIGTAIGLACIGIGLVLNVAGWSWMRHIISVGS